MSHQAQYNHWNPYTEEYYLYSWLTTIDMGGKAANITNAHSIGTGTVDTTQESLDLYINEFGNFNAYSYLSPTEDVYYYVSPKARVRMGNTTGGVNTSCLLQLQFLNESTGIWGQSGEVALGGGSGLTQYTSLYFCSWVSSNAPLKSKLFVIGRRYDDPTKWDYEWAEMSMTTPNWYTEARKGNNYPDDEPEYDDGTDDGTDTIPIPGQPTYGILSSHMVHAYVMSEGDMVSLAAQLWDTGPGGFITAIGKFFNDPAQAIISTHIVPVSPAVSSLQVPLSIGNWSSTVAANYITNEYKLYDCGTLRLDGLWGSYLDYRASVDIYLPFIGVKTLAVEDVMNARLTLKYWINVITGTCEAYISVQKTKRGDSRDILNSLVYQFSGNCITRVPVTGADYSAQVTGALNAIASVANGIAGGSPSTIISGAFGAADSMLDMKPSYRINGTIAGDASLLTSFTPYLIVSYPNAVLPSSFERDEGRSAQLSRKISGLINTGFTQFEAVILNGINCTDAERDEIEQILKEGIIL